jgi:hypothetical protein
MIQIFIGLALLLFFAGSYVYLLLRAKSEGSAEGVVYKTYAENKKLSLVVRELTCSSNRLIAICRFNYKLN